MDMLESRRLYGRCNAWIGEFALRHKWPGVTVLEPWYSSLDFLAVIATAIVILVLLANVFRRKQMSTRSQTSLDDTLAERTRVAQDFKDSFLHPEEASRHSARSAWLRTNEILPMQHTLHHFSSLLGQSLEEDSNTEALCASEPINVTFIVVGTPRELNPDSRSGVYRIGSVAIRDAFLARRVSKLLIELVFDQDFCLRIFYDGEDKTAPDPIHTRPAPLEQQMHEQAVHMGATLSLSYTPSTSTEVQLFVPGHRAYTARSGSGPETY